MQGFFEVLGAINGVMLSVPVLLCLLGVGVLFTIWSGFSQYRSLTHGIALIRGKVPGIAGEGNGVLTHFQALSAALSATVGLGNIGGVAIAVSLGGPGAVFWMWVVGLVGMAIKSTEVTLALLYRDMSNPDEPHGGTMWVCKKGFAALSPKLAGFGVVMGLLFTIPLIVFGVTGGNMFQAWNVAELSRLYFGVPTWITGLVLAILVGAVILGGIRRIGAIAGTVVPIMCALYVISGLAVLVANAEQLPAMFHLIFVSAFSPAEGVGAFTGAAFGTTFIFGMKRALFSSEAGLGSAPIAHSAVKTSEPVTEGVVAGLEPFIDTIVVCTITALVILSSGVWSRAATAEWMAQPTIVESSPGTWVPSITTPPQNGEWTVGDQVFVVVEVEQKRASLFGDVVPGNDGPEVRWRALESESAPVFAERGLFSYYPGATLTAKAFDSAFPGLGRWMVTLTVWFFALSTIITWSYYAEQGVVYLLGERAVTPYRLLWCVLVFVTCLGFIKTDTQLDTLSTIALGFMLAVNLPTMVLLGGKAMGAYKDYFRRLKLGTLGQDK
ncbi:MAG: alanine:cation symporter family protein [Gammaproteobacteria bacterium]|nr:alanine:cation symporter family protein [Gammaproteobacteria bacterium]